MFDRIKKYFRDLRIDMDFPAYERRCRSKYEEQAERKYSVKALEHEREQLCEKIVLQARDKYEDAINQKIEERRISEAHSVEIESLLFYFNRHYKQELDDLYSKKDSLISTKRDLYEELSRLKESLSEAYDDKSKAYGKLNYYRGRIDSWYRESKRTPWLLGNGGKKLPKHSLFGQSFGDLDSYKYSRDSVYEDVKDAKSEIASLKEDMDKLYQHIGELKTEVASIFQKINGVKDDRSKMYELKQAGHNRRNLQSKLEDVTKKINHVDAETMVLEEKKAAYINLLQHRYGIDNLDSKINQIENNKRRYLKSFYLVENQNERRRLHRQAWLSQRGMA